VTIVGVVAVAVDGDEMPSMQHLSFQVHDVEMD
jgi:hypothetical protein